jgi:hypothetical protein
LSGELELDAQITIIRRMMAAITETTRRVFFLIEALPILTLELLLDETYCC